MKFQDVQQAVSIEIEKILEDLDQIRENKFKIVFEKQKEIDELKKEIQNLIGLIAIGGLTATTVKDELELRQQKINKLELELQMSNFHGIENTKKVIYSALDMDKKKAIVQELIDKILLSQNGDIEILWKI